MYTVYAMTRNVFISFCAVSYIVLSIVSVARRSVRTFGIVYMRV